MQLTSRNQACCSQLAAVRFASSGAQLCSCLQDLQLDRVCATCTLLLLQASAITWHWAAHAVLTLAASQQVWQSCWT